jgi:hypothetical protein
MFALVNSGIHAMMYTYYTVAALGFRVPNIVKRTLTTLQITQFLVGSAFAAFHLFVSYTVPVSVAYKVTEKVAPKLSSTISSTVSSAVSAATESVAEVLPTATGAAVAFLRKLVYRAAGDEGLAENIAIPGQPHPVHQQQPIVTSEPAPHHNPVQEFFRPETVERTVYRTEYQSVPCIDTSGQAFAVYVNLIYLAPLTILFMRFFFKSYLRRSSPNNKARSKARTISDAAGDASRSVERLDKSAEDAISSGVNRARDAVRGRKPANSHIKDERQGSMSPANQKMLDSINAKVNQKLQELDDGAEATTRKAKELTKDLVGKAEDAGDKLEKEYEDSKDEVKQEVEDVDEKAKENASERPSSNGSDKQSKLPRKQNKKGGQAQQSPKKKQQTDEAVAKSEKEPEPKDINNTLNNKEGKGLF